MVIRYITFGLGSVRPKNYLVARGPDEHSIRVALNQFGKEGGIKLPWAGCYAASEFSDQPEKHGLVRLPRNLEVVTAHNYGPSAPVSDQDLAAIEAA